MSNRLVCISVLTVALATAGGLAQTEVTEISDATRAVAGELTDAQKAEVDSYVARCAQRMTDPASDITTVKSCRVALVTSYGGNQGEGYMRYYATAVGSTFAPKVFAGQQPAVVLVNAAIAVGQIDQVEIAPELAKMIRHPNAAVRYHAAKGFGRIAGAVLARGDQDRDAMLTTLETAAGTEQNPSIVRAIMQALDLSAVKGGSPTTLQGAQATARRILTAMIARHMQAVRDGKASMADAFGYAVEALGAMTVAGVRLSPEDRTAVLQTLADVMANTARAYEDLSVQTDAGRERILVAPGAYRMLLVYCERAIGGVTGQPGSNVSRTINESPRRRGDITRVLLAVNALVGTADSPGALQTAGVTAPTALAATVKAETPDSE